MLNVKHSIFFTFFVPIVLIAENVDWKPILTPYIGSSFVMPEEHEYWSVQGRTHDSKAVSSQPSLIDIACQQKSNKICMQEQATQAKYAMSFACKQQLLSLSYADFLKKVTSQESLSDEQILMLWNEFKDKRCWNYGNEKTDYENKLKEFLGDRKVKRLRQQQIKDAQERLLQQQQAQSLTQRQKPYVDIELLFAKESSFYAKRTQALAQTAQEGYQKYEASHAVDAQTAGMLEAHGIDSKQFQSLSGTVFQHQLFKECADHYKKAAKALFEHGLRNSGMVGHIVEITNIAFASTQQEACALAVTLSDIAEILADTSLSLCKGLIEYGCNTIDMLRNPQQLAGALVRGIQFIGGALSVYDQQGSVGFTNMQACRQLFADDVVLFNQMCEISKKHYVEWYQASSGQEKIQEVTKLVADFTITPWLVSKIMKVVGAVLCEAQNAVKFGRVIELAEELGLGFQEAQELLYATQEGLPQIPTTVLEVETAITSLIESEGLFIELQSESILVHEEITNVQKISEKIEYVNKEISSYSVNAQDALQRKLRALENIMNDVVKVRELSDGRIRYYTKQALAKTAGPTKGSCFVMEYNGKKGLLRAWQECYDHVGNVNRVHPKMKHGLTLNAQHYPPTKAEFVSWQGIKK